MIHDRLWKLALNDVEEFRTLCERLRKLGVTKLGPLTLGPLPEAEREPVKPLTAEELLEKEERRRQRHMDVALAATSMRPSTPPPALNGAGKLPNAVLRRQAQEAQRNGSEGK